MFITLCYRWKWATIPTTRPRYRGGAVVNLCAPARAGERLWITGTAGMSSSSVTSQKKTRGNMSVGPRTTEDTTHALGHFTITEKVIKKNAALKQPHNFHEPFIARIIKCLRSTVKDPNSGHLQRQEACKVAKISWQRTQLRIRCNVFHKKFQIGTPHGRNQRY